MAVIRGPILDRLGYDHSPTTIDGDCGRVFEVEGLDNGTFRIREMCDEYFWVDLTAQELKQLGEELIAAADGPLPVAQA